MYNILPGCRSFNEEFALFTEWIRAGLKNILYKMYELNLALNL